MEHVTQILEELNSKLSYEMAVTQAQDRDDDLRYYRERAGDIAAFLKQHRAVLLDYVTFCEERGFLPDEAAYNASEQVTEQMEAGLQAMQAKLEGPVPEGKAYYAHVAELDRMYRVLMLLKVPAVRVMSWGSSAYGQSLETFHFQPEQYGGLGDRFNYDRTDSPDLRRWRDQMKHVLGAEAHGLVAVASGTAAFTMIFDYLVQRVLAPGFTVYAPRMIYGETDLLLREDSQLYRMVMDDLTEADAIVARITTLRPDVIMLEGMRNAQGNPLIDIAGVMQRLNALDLDKDLYVLVDDTLLSGAYVVADMVVNPKIKVFQYLSSLKYLQLGLDAGFSGAVIVPTEQEKSLRTWASWLGLVLYDSVALTYPAFDRGQFVTRMRRLTRNSYIMAQTLQSRFGESGLRAMHPLMDTLPQFAVAAKLPFTGALVTLDVAAVVGQQVSEKNLKPLIVMLEKVLAQAHKQGLSVAMSESFGLNTPRVTVNWCKRTKPYIRISAGDRSLEETVAIANLIADELLRQLG